MDVTVRPTCKADNSVWSFSHRRYMGQRWCDFFSVAGRLAGEAAPKPICHMVEKMERVGTWTRLR